MKNTVKVIMACLILLSMTNAGQEGSCDRGSDAKCNRYGDKYCCAYIDIKSSSD